MDLLCEDFNKWSLDRYRKLMDFQKCQQQQLWLLWDQDASTVQTCQFAARALACREHRVRTEASLHLCVAKLLLHSVHVYIAYPGMGTCRQALGPKLEPQNPQGCGRRGQLPWPASHLLTCWRRDFCHSSTAPWHIFSRMVARHLCATYPPGTSMPVTFSWFCDRDKNLLFVNLGFSTWVLPLTRGLSGTQVSPGSGPPWAFAAVSVPGTPALLAEVSCISLLSLSLPFELEKRTKCPPSVHLEAILRKPWVTGRGGARQ